MAAAIIFPPTDAFPFPHSLVLGGDAAHISGYEAYLAAVILHQDDGENVTEEGGRLMRWDAPRTLAESLLERVDRDALRELGDLASWLRIEMSDAWQAFGDDLRDEHYELADHCGTAAWPDDGRWACRSLMKCGVAAYVVAYLAGDSSKFELLPPAAQQLVNVILPRYAAVGLMDPYRQADGGFAA